MIKLGGSFLLIALGFAAAEFLAYRFSFTLLSLQFEVRRRFVIWSLSGRVSLAS